MWVEATPLSRSAPGPCVLYRSARHRLLRTAVVEELLGEEPPIAAVAGDQLVVRSGLHDPPRFHHDDAVGAPYGGHAVRDHDRRATAGDARQRLANLRFGFGVHGGCG